MSVRIDNDSQKNTTDSLPHWVPGLDLLRVIWIFFVLCMHANVTQTASAHFGSGDEADVFDAIRFHLLSAAVPGFLIMSSFLQARKGQLDWNTQKKQLVDLCYLYAFWVGLWVLLTRSRPVLSPMGILEFGMRGGGWAFYYFFVLIVIHFIVALTHRAKNATLWWCLVMSTILCFSVFSIMSAHDYVWTRVNTYWWPIAFFPTAFIGMLFARYENQLRSSSTKLLRWVAGGLLILIFLCMLEWRMAPATIKGELREFLPEYLRISPMLSASICLACSLLLTKSHTVLRFFSRNSLGVFCLHVFFLGGISKLIARSVPDPLLASILCVIATLIGASILSESLRFVMKSRLI